MRTVTTVRQTDGDRTEREGFFSGAGKGWQGINKLITSIVIVAGPLSVPLNAKAFEIIVMSSAHNRIFMIGAECE